MEGEIETNQTGDKMSINCNLFKNNRRENDRQPEYRGDGKDENGVEYWISAWVKEGAKGKYFSCSIQPKEQRVQD